MADYSSSLPVRSEQEENHVRIRLVDKDTDTQIAKIDSDQNLHVKIHGNDPANADEIIRTSENGEIAIDGTYDVANNTNPANIGIVTQERNAASADSRQTMKPTAIRGTTATDTVSLDVALHDSEGEDFTASNPLPVYMAQDPGLEVQDYNTAAAVAVGASSNHNYTVGAGDTFNLRSIWASSSGAMKIEVQYAADGATFGTKFVAFNSTANPNISIDMQSFGINDMPAGAVLRIIRTNRDKQPQDVYSTISGITL